VGIDLVGEYELVKENQVDEDEDLVVQEMVLVQFHIRLYLINLNFKFCFYNHLLPSLVSSKIIGDCLCDLSKH
jgi:hypothetical protein